MCGCPFCTGRGDPIIDCCAPCDEARGPVALPSTAARIRLACSRIEDMLLKKNAAYGDSALDPVRIFSTASTSEQIRVRLDDKVSRLVRGNAAGEDVILDLIGYLVLLLIAEAEQ